MSRTAALLIVLFVGLAMMVGGVYHVTVGPVKCNDKTVMHDGDVCKGRFRHPSGTYDELHTTQQVVGGIIAGLGLAVIVWAIVKTVKSSRRRSTAPQPYLPPGNPPPGVGPQHYRPQPGGQYYYPPQHPPPGRPPGPPHYPPPGPGQYRPPPPRR
ncbi:hypothetical protein A9W98_30285 [Mycobacterium gordonae]|jgi:hypothetical protein|uniref:Uncharacterized protein n=1 Tax=Mycobacterium gordonae TaxID=1778 RepID=A0A1A6BB07_MYCGO|nr:hypothetical protein [Mycobacterium gordonae]MBI2700270.1 hypothetical protein [Mycobacterium sp.]OBR99433.1 hypothetical protein A9W98_30285 [Mycobacterium gordonae]